MKYGLPPRAGSASGGKIALIVLGGLMLLFVFAGLFACSGYNRAIALDEDVKARWAQVDNQLKRRFDLIPNLVEVVKGYAAHEKEIFENLAKARQGYAGAKTTSEKAKAAGEVESAIARLLMIVENYPNLKANENFARLQDELAGTENRIAVERMRYNEAVKTLNAFTRRFPSRVFAGWAGVEAAAYFEVPEEEKKVPKVDFKS
ncbi:MAG: LemA family protein [Planctomycetes bacterium]|nr:LemA family protein [Planctomycetota bacterium]